MLVAEFGHEPDKDADANGQEPDEETVLVDYGEQALVLYVAEFGQKPDDETALVVYGDHAVNPEVLLAVFG